MKHEMMHKRDLLPRQASSDYLSSTIFAPDASRTASTTGDSSRILTDGRPGTIYTTYTGTFLVSYSQAGVDTLVTSTTVRPVTVTNAAEYSSLVSAEASHSTSATEPTSKPSAAASATSSSESGSSSSSNNLSTLIPAIVVPVVVVLLVSFGLFAWFMRRRHRQSIRDEPEFIMASKMEKLPSRGNSQNSRTSSTRQLVPMNKSEKKGVNTAVSEASKSPLDLFPPAYNPAEIGIARPMTPPDKSAKVSFDQARARAMQAPAPSMRNFSGLRTDAAHYRPDSRNQGEQQRNGGRNNFLPPGSRSESRDGRRSPYGRSGHGPGPDSRLRAGSGMGSGPQATITRAPGFPSQGQPSSRASSPSRGNRGPGRPTITTGISQNNRAAPPSALSPPTPTGAFNGASPISQYSPIVKEMPLHNTVATDVNADKSASPVDENVLSKENRRIARLANSPQLGLHHADSKHTPTSIDPQPRSPRPSPPVIREARPTSSLSNNSTTGPHIDAAVAKTAAVGVGAGVGGGLATSTKGVPPASVYAASPSIQNSTSNMSTPVIRHSEAQFPRSGRASIISRVSDDDYIDMEVDAKSDISSLDERERWELESDISKRNASHEALGFGYSNNGQGSSNLRDRDSEGPFVLSRY